VSSFVFAPGGPWNSSSPPTCPCQASLLPPSFRRTLVLSGSMVSALWLLVSLCHDDVPPLPFFSCAQVLLFLPCPRSLPIPRHLNVPSKRLSANLPSRVRPRPGPETSCVGPSIYRFRHISSKVRSFLLTVGVLSSETVPATRSPIR